MRNRNPRSVLLASACIAFAGVAGPPIPPAAAPSAPSVPGAAKQEIPKDVAAALASAVVTGDFAEAPSVSATVVEYRTEKGSWVKVRNGSVPDVPRAPKRDPEDDHPRVRSASNSGGRSVRSDDASGRAKVAEVIAVRVEYAISDVSKIYVQVDGGDGIVWFGGLGAGDTQAASAPWSVVAALPPKSKARIRREFRDPRIVRDLMNDLRSRPSPVQPGGGASPRIPPMPPDDVAEAVQKLLGPHAFQVCIEGRLVVSAKLVAESGRLRLAATKVDSMEKASLPASVVQAIRKNAELLASFRREMSAAVPPICSTSVGDRWSAELVEAKVRTSMVPGCRHCMHRPDAPSAAAYCPQECPGCQHLVDCDGSDPERCEGCRRQLDREHVVTASEKIAYDRAVQGFMGEELGEGIVERRIRIPCTHGSPSYQRTVTDRTWSLSVTAEFASSAPRIARVVFEPTGGMQSIAAACRPLPGGGQAIVFSVPFVESTAGSTKRPPTAPVSHVDATPGDLLKLGRMYTVLADDRVCALRFDADSGKILADRPSFGQWCAAQATK